MRLWITIALVALLTALLWSVGGQTRADAPPAEITETTALRYETYDLMGKAATPGSYAFLPGSDDATSAVATYEGLRDGTAKRLLIHKTDAQGTSRAPLYDAVAAGALFEWRKADDCWVRHRVTQVLPDPPGAAPRKLLGVEWKTYAFTGCSGPIAASTAAVIEWGPLPDLGGASLTSPVVHGPYQLVPEGWRGAVQEPRTYPSPGYSAANPAYTQDLAAARRLPYWHDPALPAGWTFSWATAGDVSGPTYGYWAVFATERGRHGVTIFGYYADYRGHPEDASWLNARGAFETRTIAGRPARVAYSPPGPSHDDLFPVTVWIYDSSTETEYAVLGKVKSLRGSNVDAVVAIARSLFEGANEAAAAPQGTAGPGESPAPLATPPPLFEWWADGRPASPPLDLKLRSSRELCTAGTLTEISWTISGGVAPYELSIEGAAVDLDADNIRINCGALTDAEAGDEEAALAAKTVSAVVTDSRGVQRQAALEVDRARALPAPTGLGSAPQGSTALFWWDEVSGAGSQSPPFYRYSGAPPQHRRYLLRHQPTGAATWTYKLIDNNIVTLGLPDGERLVSVAAIRHPLEAETPDVLVWSAPTDHANVTPPANVTITATHDTITVSWDVQRHVPEGHVALLGPNGVLTRGFQSSRSASRESVRFTNLPPATNFTVRLKIGWFESNLGQITEQIATESAPPGYRSLPAGPQRLQLTATHDSITATWEPPFSGAESLYSVTVFEERTGRKVARRMVHGGATTWTEYGSFTHIQPATTYRVVVRHGGIRGGQVEATATTQGAAGPGESPAPFARPEPLFEWWADGRPASPPLDLKLESSRELCTAGTLTEISWEISGGVAPYSLSVEGEAVDASADNVRVNCGALTEAEAGDAETALAAKTVSAVVTDSRGVQRQAALDVARARALPAPQNVGYDAHVVEVGVYWDEVNGAGAQSPTTVDPDTQNRLTVTGMIRTRANQDGAGWTYHTVNRSHPYWTLDPPVEFRVLSVAAVRHPLELETPAALNWSDEIVYTAMKLAQNVTIAATHDTMTVSWDRQPYAAGRAVWVLLYTANDVYVGRNGSRLVRLREEEGVSGRHEVAFAQLPPDTDLAVLIVMGGDAINARSTTHPVRTQTPPAGWAAPPSGPQNLRYASANDTLTVYWDEPYSAEGTSWSITITNPTTGTTYRTGSYSSSWTWPQSVSRLPNKEYHITIAHTDLGRGAAEITVRTPPARPAGQAESLASFARPEPLFEWWADGRPTSPPLDLKLESSRDLCTAGTLTEISWQISGGVAPYELSIEGAAVDVDAENIRINCGALTEAEAGDAEAALAAKTVTATVTDSRGVQRQAALDVARARALPAPIDLDHGSQFETVTVTWEEVDSSLSSDAMVRYRPIDGAKWTYIATRDDGAHSFEPPTGEHMASVAVVRHPLELETPDALVWSEEVRCARVVAAQNLTVAATHDTVTVSWDKQPYTAQMPHVRLTSPSVSGSVSDRVFEVDGEYGRHEVVFKHVLPSMDYVVRVVTSDGGVPRETGAAVRTAAAPSGWTPPPRGPQNLRATAASDGIAVTWGHPHDRVRANYVVQLIDEHSGDLLNLRWISTRTNWTIRSSLNGAPLRPGRQYRIHVKLMTFGLPADEVVVRMPAAWPLAPPAEPKPRFEWWADGRPTSPPLHLELRSSRELCTAGTLTEISWEISGGVAPYELSIEGETVDVDADNIRINCGPLPADPVTGEIIASQTKTFRASVSDSRGVATAASVAVTLTTPSYLAADTALRYETYDLTGGAAAVGSYAFLGDGAAGAVATYEGLRDGSATQLLIHKTDAQGTPRATLYDAVASGDLFEWRQAYDCWVRYRVTEVRPDPPGDAQRKQLAVERISYAFSGCSGAIAADAAVLFAWGPLPDLGGPTLAAPLRHGPFQIVPEDWERPIEEDPYRPWPRNSYTNPVRTTDLTEARRLSHWRDPTLPSGWTLVWASSGDYYSDPPDGYCSWWATDRGYGGVELCGGFYPVQDRPRESSESSGAAVVETRMIAGRPAIVEYSPAGPNHNPYVAVRVLVSDPILDVVYHVRGLDGTLRGDRVNAGIAIARSLFEESN